MPPPLRGYQVLPQHPPFTITGVTRDSAGAALGTCDVELYVRNQAQTQGTYINRTVSDGSGNFAFNVGIGQFYQHIAYKTGSPDVAGISLRTLVGAESTGFLGV
jgi:GH24 family phage-related lysozyme (muramidase)